MISSGHNRPDYSGVTETPGTLVSRHAASMAVSRYELVRRMAAGKRVLEVACGSGQGLGYVGASAARIVGGDITAGLLTRARQHYGGRVPLVRFDAHALPFVDRTFDIIQLHEAIYYMARPAAVFAECRRVLSSGGIFVMSSINPEWPDFHPSPHSSGYLDAASIRAALEREFGRVEILLGFPVNGPGKSGLLSSAKRAASRLGLIPKTMRGKTLLKRIFLGPLITMPHELTPGFAAVDEPSRAGEARAYRIIYAVAQR